MVNVVGGKGVGFKLRFYSVGTRELRGLEGR